MSSKADALDTAWSRQEFGVLDLGDTRLNERLVRVAAALAAHPQLPVPGACADWAATKAAYRLFDTEKVTPEKILAPHVQSTIERMREHARVFAIQDTTYLDYTHHPSTEGLGPIGTKAQHLSGFVKHTTLVCTESGLPLGCLTDKVWVRPVRAKKSTGASVPIPEKESAKWRAALADIKARAPEAVEVICLGDREADIYEFFVEAAETPFVIRAAQNRRVASEHKTLNRLVRDQPAAGEIVVKVPARGSQVAREAVLTVRFTSTTLVPPRREPSATPQPLPPVAVHVVWVSEGNPPAGATPLEWLLLTNVKVTNASDAVERIRWYCLRWHIEVYFKVLRNLFRIRNNSAIGDES